MEQDGMECKRREWKKGLSTAMPPSCYQPWKKCSNRETCTRMLTIANNQKQPKCLSPGTSCINHGISMLCNATQQLIKNKGDLYTNAENPPRHSICEKNASCRMIDPIWYHLFF